MKTVWTYYGYVIFRNTIPGYALRYTCLGPNGRLAADTLAGMRELIREALGK